jgi:hypothetical protein
MLDSKSLFRLEALKDVRARFAQPEAELLGHVGQGEGEYVLPR